MPCIVLVTAALFPFPILSYLTRSVLCSKTGVRWQKGSRNTRTVHYTVRCTQNEHMDLRRLTLCYAHARCTQRGTPPGPGRGAPECTWAGVLRGRKGREPLGEGHQRGRSEEAFGGRWRGRPGERSVAPSRRANYGASVVVLVLALVLI